MKKILLLLSNGFEALEASAFTDVLGWNKWEGDGSTEVVTVGLHETLQCTWNFSVKPEQLLQNTNLDEFDALAIPGGFEEAGFYEDGFSAMFQTVIHYFHNRKKPIATICVASLLLGKSGILTGCSATTYHHPTSIRPQQLADFGAIYCSDRLVIHEHIITSANPSTALDVAFALLEMLTTKENTLHVKELMGISKN